MNNFIVYVFWWLTSAVQGKGHLQTCIAGRKDNLRSLILRKDNPKIMIKILVNRKHFKDCKEIRKDS